MIKVKNFFTINGLLIVLLTLNAIFGIYTAFIKPDAYALEALKAWWKDNMKLAVQLYKSDMNKEQVKNMLEQSLASLSQAQVVPTEEVNSSEAPVLTLEDGKLEKMMQGAYITWNKKARITLVTYSDFWCSYCRKQYNNQTLEKLVEKYPNEVNMVFKNFPIGSPLLAQWSVCVAKLAGVDKYYQYIAKGFSLEELSEEILFDMATSLGVNKSKFTSCLSNPETMVEITASTEEAKWFGMNWTPGNLIIDNEKGTYVVLPGAYPIEAFDTEIQKILK